MTGTVTVTLDGSQVALDRDVFAVLFGNSVVSSYAGVRRALGGLPLPFKEFTKLAAQAEIPYPLFLAPIEVVEAQVRLKTEKLLAGFTKTSFSMHSRHKVELRDVELIVKDLLRKQELLRRYDNGLVRNEVVGVLKGSRRSVAEDAKRVLMSVGLSRTDLREAKSKEVALEVFISRLESRQILVSRSAQHNMPQQMPARAKFSGLTIKDTKVPFIFLATGDEGEHLEPAGRKIFTLALLTVLIAQGTFAPVSYDGHTKDESSPRAYDVTAEMLMPAAEFRELKITDLQSVKETADAFRVTPSAVAMRARRLGLLDLETFTTFMDELQIEYGNRPKVIMTSPRPVNALRRYNGLECSRRMLSILDAGHISRADFRRIMFFNKIPASQINDFRAAVS